MTGRAQRKPRAEPESEPEGEPENFPGIENQANSDPDSEPESKWNSTAESEPTAENWPEPAPRWEEAYETWKWSWELHVYLYATIFLAIGLYAGYYVFANVYDGLQGKYLSVSLNIMVTLFGFTRAFVMYLDPYHQGNIIHDTVAMRVIWSLSGPCLTASDCLMILALIETTKISIAPQKLQKASVNVAIIILHFTLVITTDCVVADYVEAKAMLLFCQLFFVKWGSVLGTANFVLGYKLDQQLFKTPKERADKIYIYLIYASGAANYILCGIMIYSAFGVFGVYSDVKFVDAWQWWALQTISRSSEILACVLIFTVSAKRTRVKKAVSIVRGDKDFICSTEEGNSSDSKNVDGSKISPFTALREIALMQVTGNNWHDTKTRPRVTAPGECWIETQTTRSVIRVPGVTAFHSPGSKCDDLLNNEEEKEKREYLELEFTRKESMFTALHEATKISITKFSPGENFSSFNAGLVREEEEMKNENHATNGSKSDKNLRKYSITMPNEAIFDDDQQNENNLS